MNKKHKSPKNSPVAASFQDPRTGRFVAGRHWRPPSRIRDKQYLFEQYAEKQRSASDIAAENNVTENAILWWLTKHGIPRRTVKQARAIKKWGLRGKQNGMYGRCGSKNPRWVDGSSPERQSLYARSVWKELIRLIYKRDNYRCVRCGAVHSNESKLHAHHTKPWAGNPSHRFDADTIITLCEHCHRWVHSNRNTDREFLSC